MTSIGYALALFWAHRLPSHAALFVIGFVLNEVVNHFLKKTIRAPRPNEDMRLFRMEVASGRPIDVERYGMPSHHAQMMMYVSVFMVLTFRKAWMAVLFGLATLYVCVMRVQTGAHSVAQVLAGAAIGALISYGVYYGGWAWITKKREVGLREDGFLLSNKFSFS
jgi:membrane-associated phospholipid phosphatase